MRQANAVHLAAQLPDVQGGCRRVLYPASVKAGTDLQASSLYYPTYRISVCVYTGRSRMRIDHPTAVQDGLAARGFDVMRLNTYNTVAVTTVAAHDLKLAKQARVVAVASPSAVKCAVG